MAEGIGHFLNQHELPPVMTSEQVRHLIASLVDGIEQALSKATVKVASAPAVLSDEQFAELKRLLDPGYELSKFYLDQQRAVHAAPAGQLPGVRPASFEPALSGPLGIEPAPSPQVYSNNEPVDQAERDWHGPEKDKNYPDAPASYPYAHPNDAERHDAPDVALARAGTPPAVPAQKLYAETTVPAKKPFVPDKSAEQRRVDMEKEKSELDRRRKIDDELNHSDG